MSKVKCPHCGVLVDEIKNDKITEHFICDECKSMFHSIKENGEIKVELEA